MTCRLKFITLRVSLRRRITIRTVSSKIYLLCIAGTKTYLLCRSGRHAFTSAFCNTLLVGCLKFCFSLEIRSSIWPFTIAFQDDRTESPTISRSVHCNVYWSTASHKSDKFYPSQPCMGLCISGHLQLDLSIWNLE